MKKISKTLISGLLCLWWYSSFSQQDPQYTQYFFNTLSVNPAYAGISDRFSVSVLGREQWVGMDGAPRTQTLVIQSPLGKSRIGLGASFVHDKIGPTNASAFFFDGSYWIRFNGNRKLSMGLKAGIKNYTIELLDLKNVDTTDPNFGQNVKGDITPSFGFGLFYKTPSFFVGASIPDFLQNELTSGGTEKEAIHYFVMAGKSFDIDQNITLIPTTLFKIVRGAPLDFDITLRALFQDRIWAGLFHRLGDSVGLLVGMKMTDNFDIGLAYDQTISRLSKYNSGSYELMLRYSFDIVKSKIVTPRMPFSILN